MLAFETTASIVDHRLVIQDAALPAHAERVRVIVLWESTKPVGRRSPPPALAGMGEEKGGILRGKAAVDAFREYSRAAGNQAEQDGLTESDITELVRAYR